MLKVAITGSLSSGKSTVCHILKTLGAYVTSADEIVHHLLALETETRQKVVSLLGNDIISQGQIDRRKIAKKVFQTPQLLRDLEQLIHPAVRKEIEAEYQKALNQHAPLFVAEIPLLFEAAQDSSRIDWYDCIISVNAQPQHCLVRFMNSTGYGKDEYHKRVVRQLSPQEKAQRASFVIDNNGSEEELEQQVKKIFHQLTHR